MEQKKILIADDELSIRQLVKKLLDKGYTILEAKDGNEAVDVAYMHRPNLILMDIMMPKMDGITACYALKRNRSTKAIPVVMLTGVDYELNKRLSEEIGAAAYITKPFSLQDLLQVVGKFIRNR